MDEIQATQEEAVIGAALAESPYWLKHAADVTPGLFETYRVIGAALCDMHAASHPTDPRSTQGWLDQKGTKTSMAGLLALEDKAPYSEAGLVAAIESLVEAAKRKALAQVAERLLSELQAGRARAEELTEAACGALARIGYRSSSVEPIGDTLRKVVRDLGRPRQDGAKTGIRPIDTVTGGLKPGELVVLGARPSMGKTAMALGFAAQAAQSGKSVLVFSLEMSAEQVCERVLAALSAVDLARIVTHRVSATEITTITSAANVAHKWRFFCSESAGNIEAVCRHVQHRHGLDLVVVDYLQLMSGRAQSREQEIAKLSRSLKLMAGKLKVPVLVLSQLNRKLEERQSKRPMLSDLRESGAIEQDADMVLLLWRPGYYDAEDDQTLAEVEVAKNRHGPVGRVDLDWHETSAKFTARKTGTSQSDAICDKAKG